MYIDPFLAGVLTTVFVEMVIGVAVVIKIGSGDFKS